jgi:cellulase/cellobiase CelA1
MDSFNKVISFVLGLVVVLVFFAVVTGKINLTGKTKTISTSKSILTPTPTQKSSGGFFSFLKRATPTPTPTKKLTSSVTINNNENNENNENNVYKQNSQISGSSNIKTIPSTGLPTLFIPILFSGLIGGSFLRKTGKK